LNRRVAVAWSCTVATCAGLLCWSGGSLLHRVPRWIVHLPARTATALSSTAQPTSYASAMAMHDLPLDDDGPAPQVEVNYDLSAHQTLSRVNLLIRENYVEPERIKPYEMFLAALDYIQKTVAEVMVDDSQAPKRITVSVGEVSQAFDLGELDQLWEVTMALRDIFRFLQNRVADPAQRRDIEYAAINGMLSTLDPHSILLKPESFDEVKLQTKGEFGGLGIVISLRDGALTVMTPIEGTPASEVGLKAKDTIVKIGEESTMSMGLDEAVQRLRGAAGSKVVMWIQRKNWSEPRKFVLTRAIIKIESVSSELLPDGVGYIKLKSFQNNSYDDLQAHLEKLHKKNHHKELKGLVLDMRNNPGGLLDQAISISDRFIDRGPLVITVSEGSRSREVKWAHASDDDRKFPIAVLLNGGSASASEIVSGALKNTDRALIIGQQSFGKGSVQVLYDFKDRSALKLTISQYLTPGDESIQSVGITPDVQIVPAMIEPGNAHLFVDDDSPREKDLEKHLDRHGAVSQINPAQQLKITYLLPKEKTERQAGDANGTAAAEIDDDEPARILGTFEYDFETRLAHDVLVKARSMDRKAILTEAMPLFAARAQEQEDLITKRLAELDVDWSPGPAQAEAGAPRAEVQIKTGAFAAPAMAGSTVTLTGSVRNSGTAPLYRVYGVTASDNPLFKGQEFIFGKVMPGQTRTWDIKTKLPADMGSRADSVTLALGDYRGVTRDVSSVTFVHITEQQRPHFAFAYQVDDVAGGNGDGVLQVGEKVNLQVDVKNLGPGMAEDVTVTLKNMVGKALFLERGRSKIGKLAVGDSKVASFRFVVKSPTPAAKLRLLVWDGALGAPLSKTFSLPLQEAHKRRAEDAGLRTLCAASAATKPCSVRVLAGADANAPVLGQMRPGILLHAEARFGAWYRVSLPGATPKVGFIAAANLEPTPSRRYSRNGFTPAAGATTPTISLALPSLVTEASSLQLKVQLCDKRQLKDVFVFVNDKKVFYRALQHAKRTSLGVQASLDLAVQLKEGANQIAIILREDDDMIGRKVFGVFRSGPHVATKLLPENAPAADVPPPPAGANPNVGMGAPAAG
jgi:carboxyl-terminal processing protease